MAFAIVTKVRTIIHNRFVLAECKLKLDSGWDRTILVDLGSEGVDMDGESRRRFNRDHVVVHDNSILIAQTDLTAGAQYLMDLYDCNIPSEFKTHKVYNYFMAVKKSLAYQVHDSFTRVYDRDRSIGGR